MKRESPVHENTDEAAYLADHEPGGRRVKLLSSKRPWLVLLTFGMMAAVIAFLPIPTGYHTAAGLDIYKLKVGLAVFLGIGVLGMTEALPLSATALLVPLMVVVLGVSDAKAALVSFADPLIFLLLGGFALAAAMARQSVDRWLAQKLVQLGGGKFLPVSRLLFGATAFLSMWMSNTATTAMMIPLALGILGRLKTGEIALRMTRLFYY